jgi:hypothetical protein
LFLRLSSIIAMLTLPHVLPEAHTTLQNCDACDMHEVFKKESKTI